MFRKYDKDSLGSHKLGVMSRPVRSCTKDRMDQIAVQAEKST